jgi:hypothetical protein
MICITVKNSVNENLTSQKKLLVSDKRGQKNHGLGIKTINNITEKYSGTNDFYIDRGMFYCKVNLLRKYRS